MPPPLYGDRVTGQEEAAPLPEAQEDGRGDDQRREGERVAHRVDDVKRQELLLRGALCAHRGQGIQGEPTTLLSQSLLTRGTGRLSPTGTPELRKGITYGDGPRISRTLF